MTSLLDSVPRQAHDSHVRQAIIGAGIGLVLGLSAAFSIAAVWGDGRDACARLADLESATTIGDDRSLFLMSLDNGGEKLLKDCIND